MSGFPLRLRAERCGNPTRARKASGLGMRLHSHNGCRGLMVPASACLRLRSIRHKLARGVDCCCWQPTQCHARRTLVRMAKRWASRTAISRAMDDT